MQTAHKKISHIERKENKKQKMNKKEKRGET
jgi:hypothetical protein